MADDLVVNDRWTVPAAELSWRFSRASGPGGQSVNTADSRVELVFSVTTSTSAPSYIKERVRKALGDEVVVAVSDTRSQLKNRRLAEERMAAKLREAAAPPAPPRRATRPTRSSQRQRVDEKKRRGEVKRLRRKTDD